MKLVQWITTSDVQQEVIHFLQDQLRTKLNLGPADPNTAWVGGVFDASNIIQGGISGRVSFDWLYIQLMWIHPDWRAKGFGRTLIGECEERARKAGLRGLWVDTFFPEAIGFYQKQGFQKAGEIPAFFQSSPRVFLYKNLEG